jgi:hypothetical protein
MASPLSIPGHIRSVPRPSGDPRSIPGRSTRIRATDGGHSLLTLELDAAVLRAPRFCPVATRRLVPSQ